MAWNEQVRYDINENEVLSVWSTGINYVVRIDNPVNNSAYILHTSKDESDVKRFFELVKAAYKELIF